ncbi:MAG: amidohydrolase family protein, partial [Gemmatimonadaceae bacterium]
IPIDGGTATRLTSGLPWDNQPRFSPDGRHIAFISDRDGMTNLWIVNADGTSPRQLSRDRKNTISSPAWMTDGPSVVVRKSIWGTGGGIELWVYHRDGGSGVRLADRARLTAPSGPTISTDARYVFFSGGGGGGAQLYRLDRRNGAVSQLTGGTGPSFRPQLSPDGRLLAFARRQDARTELRLYDIATGRDRLLLSQVTRDATEGGGPDFLPGYAFTPDGTSIVITIAGKIARVDVATGAVRDIPYRAHQSLTLGELVRSPARTLGGDSLVARVMRWPRLSPDGRRLVFSALAHLWVMDLPNGQPRRLTTGTDGEYSPAWSPDGRRIAYTTWSDSAWGQVRLISADGREQRTVTRIARQFLNPAWSPDGSMLAVVLGNPIAEQVAWQPNETLPYTLAWLRVADGDLHEVIQIPVPHWPERSHPVVSFNSDGTRLFFTEQQSEPQFRRALTSIRLDGTDKTVHLRFLAGDEGVPSPDGKRVALTRGDNLWVTALPTYTLTPIDLDLDSPALPATRVTRSGADFPAWQDANTLVWSDAMRLLRKRVDAAGGAADTTIRYDTVTNVRVSLPRSVPRGTIAFTNARLVTMRGEEVIGRGTIVVDGERILAIGASDSVRMPSGATVVDADGKTIIPGLIDGHAHLQFNPYGTYPQQKWPYIVNLAYGVTTAFDPWSPSHEVSEQGDMVEAGELLGPRIYSTGTWIDGRFDYLPQYVDIKNADDARGIVRRLKSLGADMLKEYVQPRREARQFLAQAAREEHIPITAEGAGDWVHDLTMVMDGYTAFEHTLPIAPVYRDVIELMVRSEVHYTPTLIVTYGGPSLNAYFTGKMSPHDDPKVRRFTPEERMDEGRRWTWVPEDELFFREVAKSATAMSRAGVLVSLGAHGNRQGIGAHWELWGRVLGGATPWEALRDATVRPAQKLGMERDLGTLEAGKLADFLVLDA